MKVRLAFVAVVATVALVGAGCQQAPTAKVAEGPSPFLAGLSILRIAASFEAANGAHCPEIQRFSMPLQTIHRDSSFDGLTHAELMTTCDDPGDGTALAQAWARGIDAELKGFGALELGRGEGTTASGATFTTDWKYESRGLQGLITVRVLPAPEGRYYSIVRIFEPS